MSQVQCPNCKGYRVFSPKGMGKLFLTISGIFWVLVLISGWLWFLFISLAIVPLVFGLIFYPKSEYQCVLCGFKFSSKDLIPPTPAPPLNPSTPPINQPDST